MEKKLRRFESLVNEKGRDDFGASGITFEVDQLIKGKIYVEADFSKYAKVSYVMKPFFVDDNGCSRDIKHNLEIGKIKEIL